mgnify:CR=1 FL=1
MIHPHSTIYRNLSDKEKDQAGAYKDLIRISAGIEDSADIINDFKQDLLNIRIKHNSFISENSRPLSSLFYFVLIMSIFFTASSKDVLRGMHFQKNGHEDCQHQLFSLRHQ